MVYMSSQRITFHSTFLILSLSVGVLSSSRRISYLTVMANNCSHRNSCKSSLRSTENLEKVDCHCLKKCSTFGTCCTDSKHRTSNGLGTAPFRCIKPYGMHTEPLFMLDTCMYGDVYAEGLCKANGVALSDPFFLVPVTSRKTGLTYKNYYCFACNEDSYSVPPVSWDLILYSDGLRVKPKSLTTFHYHKELQKWMIGNKIVHLSMKIPKDLQQYDIRCEESVIDTCAENWPDPNTQKECNAYMALARFKQGNGKVKTYRNHHCAICNFENPSKMQCEPPSQHQGGGLPLFLGLFSLHDKIHTCPKNMHYDRFSEKCRGFKCGKNQIMWRGYCKNKSSPGRCLLFFCY